MAGQVHRARQASAVMSGLAPESVPAIEERMVGGVMVPVGTGLRPMRSGVRISEPWGTAHPGRDKPAGHRVDFSVDELRDLSAKVDATLLEYPDAKDTKLASRVLKKVQSDLSVRKIYHMRHITTVDRLKTGIMRLRSLKASGDLALLFDTASEQASSENEAWRGLSVNELIRIGKLGESGGVSVADIMARRGKKKPKPESESESESESEDQDESEEEIEEESEVESEVWGGEVDEFEEVEEEVEEVEEIEEVEEVEEVEENEDGEEAPRRRPVPDDVRQVDTRRKKQKKHSSPSKQKRKRKVVEDDDDEETVWSG